MSKKGIVRGVISVVGIVSVAFILIFVFIQASEETAQVTRTGDNGKYVVTAVPIPEQLDFSGEPVPLGNFDVNEALDRELLVNTYWQSHTLLLIKRAHRYFPLIEKILAENGIPDDFKYLPVAESDLMNLVSPAGAVGYWQFRKGTAQDYALEVNSEVDERYHIEKSTEAACRFLKKSYETYGSWTMAAASYNMGRAGLNRQVTRQGTDYYYDLLLNEETGRYVYRLLALKLIMSDPEQYGFYYEEEELYPAIPTYQVTIDGPVEDFAEFAIRYSINYKVLKLFNPWLRENKLSNGSGKTYYISIPKKGFREFSLEEESTPGAGRV